ncbi:MAG: FkbM family methyltransferase [Sporichthyaceae bacterium]
MTETTRSLSPRAVAADRLKMGVRTVLARRNLDLVRDPFPRRVVAALHHLDVHTVLDVGANVGQYAMGLRAFGYRGRIVSCEPLSAEFAQLAGRAARDPNWTAVHTAVGAEPGRLTINVAANSQSSSLLPMARAHLDAAPASVAVGTETVPVTTVRELIGDAALDPARTLLKIDTQGFEAMVLDGAGERLPEFAAVQLELSYVPLYEGQALAGTLIDRMAAAGFGMFAMDVGIGDPATGRMLQADGFFAPLPRSE